MNFLPGWVSLYHISVLYLVLAIMRESRDAMRTGAGMWRLPNLQT